MIEDYRRKYAPNLRVDITNLVSLNNFIASFVLIILATVSDSNTLLFSGYFVCICIMQVVARGGADKIEEFIAKTNHEQMNERINAYESQIQRLEKQIQQLKNENHS